MSSTETAQDPYVLQVRRQISDVDSALVDLVNKRLKLVAQLKRYKDEHGISFVDPGRERDMIEERVAEGRASLSPEGVRSFYAELLALVKRELA